jgi:hypothetical protein
MGLVNRDQLLDASGTGRKDSDPVGQERGFAQAVGDEHDGFVRARQQEREVLAEDHAGLLVERAERLVHQQNAGFKAQRAGERCALAHAAGKLPGIVVGKIVETDGFEGAPRPRVTLGARHALEEHAEIDILGDRIPGKQRVLLEHEGNVARHRASDRFSEHLDAPCRRPEETAHDVEQRGFSAAAGSDQADELAVHDIERGVAQRTHVADVCFLAEPMRDAGNSDRDLVRRHAVARGLF